MGSPFDYDIGIIGAGAAGLTVASGSAQLGAKTLLVEKESELGGDCLHYGCVPSKTLIKSAHVYHLMKHAADSFNGVINSKGDTRSERICDQDILRVVAYLHICYADHFLH